MTNWYGILPLALLGHAVICVFAINRWHSCGLPRPVLKAGDLAWYGFGIGAPTAVWRSWWLASHLDGNTLPWPIRTYLALCLFALFVAVVARLRYWFLDAPSFAACITRTRTIPVVQRAGSPLIGDSFTRCLAGLPWNEVLTIEVNDKTLVLPRLPQALSGMTITHLSDLHLTGQLQPSFYELALDEALRLDSDLVVVTGDIVERRECLAWIPTLLDRLTARGGVYFILGNHEQRIGDELRVRSALSQIGWIDLGSRCLSIEQHGITMQLAGMELPWFGRRPALPPLEPESDRPFRVLLSHSPDQLPWARQQGFDLMLAGHTHGGQVRFPFLGPVLCPSWHGVKYASGVFNEHPTVMHVSRGLAGTRPLRLNCAPEIARLTLESAGH